MTMSPFEAERREFGRTAFGYRTRDVDTFVDEVHRSLSQLWQERGDAREENERLKERLERFEQIEDQLKNTLLLAQDSAEKAHEQARRESELVMREAGQKARDIVHHAHEDKQRVEMVLRDLTSAEQEARQRLRAMSAAILSHLDDTEQLVADGAAKLRSRVQATAEATAAATQPATSSTPASAEKLDVAPKAAEQAVRDAELVQSGTAKTVDEFDEPLLVPSPRAARLREMATSEAADAFFDAPPTFDPTDVAERRSDAPSEEPAAPRS